MKSKEYKEYKKMCKAHKKAIMKAAKQAANDPFDGEMGLYVMIEHLKFMKDYYTLGYNVFAEESKGRKTRLKGITEALDEYYLGFDEDDCLTNKYFYCESTLENRKVTFCENFGKPRDGRSYKEAIDLYAKECEEHKKKFYKILLKELDNWWD